MSCGCKICRDKPAPFVMACQRCGQFHNWGVYGEKAVCGNCGHAQSRPPDQHHLLKPRSERNE